MPKVMLADPRLPLPLRRAWAVFATAVAAYLVVLGAGWATDGLLLPVDVREGVQFLLMLNAAVLILWRAVSLREARAAWLALGLGLAAWTAGQLVATLASPTGEELPFPSASDAGLMLFYVGQYVAFFLLARSGLHRIPRAAWLDGAVGILLLGALGAHWVFTPLLDAGGTAAAAAVTIAFPAADVVLLALVICVVVLHGGHPGGVWWRIAGGVTLTALGDAVFALGSTDGAAPSTTTGPLAIVFSMGAACLVAAALRPTRRPRQRTLSGWPALAVPVVLFGVVLALLVLDTLGTLTPVAMALLTAAIGLIGVRGAIAFRENIALADSRRQALTDELTGLPNRRSAYAELDARCEAGAVTALMIDLDRFKELNDTLGHHAGDEALVAVAQRLGRALGDDGTLSRLGGDEFAVVLGSGATESDGLAVARRLLDALDEPLYLDDLLLPVRASIGVAGTVSGGREDLLRHADVAMYHAKANRNGVEIYASERDDHSRERLALAAELQAAITDGELVLHFQPKACLRTGRILGAEALVRWDHPERGLVPPDEFVPLVERSGLGRLLTLEVIDQALRTERAWREDGLHVPVAVNTSAATLLDVRFPDDVAELLARWDAPEGVLDLELTEATIMTDPERAQDVLARLSELGIDLSLDDFGTGYSSLSMLKRLPVRELKIDRSFITDLLDDAGDAAIVRSTVELAHNLDLRVVAEGVESEAAWDLLASWDCDVAQGYHLSPPLPDLDFRALLLGNRV
jgi:diguanylate cyclase (GGDEF)-like protein